MSRSHSLHRNSLICQTPCMQSSKRQSDSPTRVIRPPSPFGDPFHFVQTLHLISPNQKTFPPTQNTKPITSTLPAPQTSVSQNLLKKRQSHYTPQPHQHVQPPPFPIARTTTTTTKRNTYTASSERDSRYLDRRARGTAFVCAAAVEGRAGGVERGAGIVD